MVTSPAQPSAKAPSIAAAIARAAEREQAGQEYGVLSRLLKAEFAEARDRALAATQKGDVIAKRLSAFANSVVRALYDEAARRYPDAAEKVAIVATGGFGRDRLAPHSDIDLLLLHQFKDEEAIKPLLNFILYALYDAGLTVGQSVHTPQSAVAFAKTDIVTRTCYLDARLIAGDAKTFRDFSSRFDRLRLTTKNQFVKAKLAEREERHDKSNQSRFLAEPDVKEGKGGLRDLHLLRWLYKYYFDGEIDDLISKKNLLDEEDIKAFLKAEKFLWSVRVHLHALRNRANEQLTFEVQPALAERLNYADRAGTIPAERLMKHYFVNALEVGRLTRIFCAKLEEEQNRLRPRPPKMFPKALGADEAPGKPNLQIKHGRLAFQRPASARKNPRDFFRLFRAFAKRPDLDFSPAALALISQNVTEITTKVRRDEVNSALFMATLMKARDPIKTLRVMAETGFLGKFLPFFGMIAGRIEYGLYRRYAVDEQIFQSIGLLTEIRQGKHVDEHPVSTGILKAAKDLSPFYLIVLLYEARQSIAEPTTEAVEKLVRRVAKRLGAEGEALDDIAWVAARYDKMTAIAERRSLAELRAVKNFAEEIDTQSRLDLMVLLSVCHLRVVGANSWDSWSRHQLTDLYLASSAWIDGGQSGLTRWLSERDDEARKEAATLLSSWPKAERIKFLNEIPGEITRSIDAGQLARFANLARSARAEEANAAVDVHRKDGFVEAMVYAEDRPGLLADLAGAVASTGASVRTVQVLTSPDGRALDIFTMQSPEGAPLDDPELVRQLHAAMLEVAREAPKKAPRPTKRLGDRREIFSVPSAVRIDLAASDECTVVEAEGRDRPGLLYKLAAALSDIGVTIKSAHIATYGERAVDAFYIQDAPGYKITNKRRLQSIERRLLNVLNGDD